MSLGGIYAPKDGRPGKPPVALEEFLVSHMKITTLELCLDNDEAGRAVIAVMAEQYKERCQIIDSPPPIEGGDYGDLAKRQMQAEAARKRAAFCR